MILKTETEGEKVGEQRTYWGVHLPLVLE